MNAPPSASRPEAPDPPPRLREWLRRQPPGKRRQLEQAWSLAGLAESSTPDAEATGAAWASVADTLEGLGQERGISDGHRFAAGRAPARSGRTRRLVRWMSAALAAALLVGVGLRLWLQPVTVTASPGATQAVALPDGSRVTLSSASSVTYPRDLPFLNWERHVRLEGEAFFEVKQAEGTFTVATFNARAEVIGTRFNVRAWSGIESEAETPATTVTLAAGGLRLFGKGDAPRQPVTLAPGQQSRVAGAGGVPSRPAPADLRAVLAWRTGGLAFSNAPLGVILDELERRFAVEVQAPASLRSDSLSLYLPDASGPAAVLSDLCAAQDCRYHRTASGSFVVE